MSRPGRPQDEHPLMDVDVGRASAADLALRLIHLKAYADSSTRAVGRAILDIGCNDGYGTILLAAGARRAAGVDVAPQAIAAAMARPEAASIQFETVNDGRLPFPDHSFDVVTAFQVIEHVADTGPFLGEIKRVVARDGVVVFTTPNAAVRLDPGMPPWNPFHVREYSAEDLRRELEKDFAAVEVRGLFAPEAVDRIERARLTAARDRARHPRPWPLRAMIGALPEPLLKRLRTIRARRTAGDAAAIRRYGVDDLWYAAEGLDGALDLQAICRVADERSTVPARPVERDAPGPSRSAPGRGDAVRRRHGSGDRT